MIDLLLLIALAVLFLLDGYSTFIALGSGKGTESNPVMNWLFRRFGVVQSLLVTKLIASVLILSAYSQGATWVLLVLMALYLYVVWNNWKVIRG